MGTTVYNFDAVADGTELSVGVPDFVKMAGSGSPTVTVTSGFLNFVGTSGLTTYAVETGSANHRVKVKTASGKFGSYFPCNVRVSDFRNLITARRSTATTVDLIVTTNGTPATNASATVSSGDYGDLECDATGNTITVYLSGTAIITSTITTFNTATKVGVTARSTAQNGVIDEFTIIVPDPITVTSINGGSPITAGKTGIASVSTGFTGLPTTITTNASGVTCSNIGGSTNAATFDMSDRVDGGLYPKSGTSVTFTFTKSAETDDIATTVVHKTTETAVPVISPLFSLNTLANQILLQTGRTIATGDELYHTAYSDLVITTDTDFTVTDAGSFDLWLYVSSGADAGKNYYYAVTITESGDVVIGGGLTTRGLTVSGPTVRGLTVTGL